MQTMSRKAIGGLMALALSAAFAAAAFAPQQADALPTVRQAKFKLSVEGWQKNDWAASHESTGRCDASDHSYGGEYAKFKSIRPVTLKAIQIGKETPNFLIGKGLPYIDTTADVARNSVSAVGPVPDDCAVSGGGGDPVAPDCGLKTVSPYPLQLEYSHEVKNSIALTSAYADGPLYNACGGGAFPYLIDEEPLSGPIVSELPPKELFDKRIGKLIVIGTGVYDLPLPDFSDRTEVRWEVTLTRKGQKK